MRRLRRRESHSRRLNLAPVPVNLERMSRVVAPKTNYPHIFPRVPSARSLILKPCAAKCRVRGVDPRIPLKALGEKTSKGSVTT